MGMFRWYRKRYEGQQGPIVTAAAPTAWRASFAITGQNFGTYVNGTFSGSNYLHAYMSLSESFTVTGGATVPSSGFIVDPTHAHLVNPVSGAYNTQVVANTRTGSGMAIRRVNTTETFFGTGDPTPNYTNDEYGGIRLVQQGVTGFWHVTWWFRMATYCQSGKMLRIYGSPIGGNTEARQQLLVGPGGELYTQYTAGPSGAPGIYAQRFNYIGPTTATPTVNAWPTTGLGRYAADESWRRLDYFSRDHATADEMIYRMIGESPAMRHGSGIDGKRVVDTPFGGNNTPIVVGTQLEDAGGPSNVATFYPNTGWWEFDAVAVSYTWARVELGNASTWSACTTLELQPIVSWTPSSIVCEFQRGTFTPGATAYLYVVTMPPTPGYYDSVLVSPGWPVTVV